MEEILELLREHNESVPVPLELPDDDQLIQIEEEILLPIPRDIKEYLLEASDVVYGSLEPVTAADRNSLTWREGTAFVYDANKFSLIKDVNYQGEGWGLTNDGKRLIRSDGTNTLFFHNAENFSVEKTISVKFKQEAISKLNELEYAEGFIWANIWHDNRIVKINPASGNVVGVMDLSAIAKDLTLTDAESVLNGIAYDADKKAFWITGKQWPKMFLVKIQ